MRIPIQLNPLGLNNKQQQLDYLTFIANQANSSVKLTKIGNPNTNQIQYKLKNGIWNTYIIDSIITLSNKNDYVQFRNKANTLSTSLNDYVQFVMTGEIQVFGNIQSMLNWSLNVPNYSFNCLFQNCTVLTSAPQLPSLTVGYASYYSMFRGCTSLIEAPELPATALAVYCYYSMFMNCTSLTESPELSATILALGCYQQMFENCSSLVSAPQLPATTLATSCYYRMFAYCTSLVNGPSKLPSENIGNYSYGGMFLGCTKLENAPVISLTSLLSSQVDYASFMFSDAQLLSSLNVDFVEWNNSSTRNWLTSVSDSGVFYCPANLKIPSRDANGVPPQWLLFPKDVELGQIIEENGVQKFASFEFNSTTSTIKSKETFDNVYSYNLGSYITSSYKRRVAYLECTGTQYINTEVVPDFINGDSIEISFHKVDAINNNFCIFGSRQAPALNGFYALRLALVACDNNGYIQVGWSNPSDGDYTLHISNEYVISNGTSYAMPKRITCAYPMYLFTLNQDNSPLNIYYSGCKIYEWKYWKNGVLSQHLIPVIDNNDIPCMYDTIGNTFYYNSGTGTFNYGEIPPLDVVQLGEIIEQNGNQYFAKLNFDNTNSTIEELQEIDNLYIYNLCEYQNNIQEQNVLNMRAVII